MNAEDAERSAAIIEGLFSDLIALRDHAESVDPGFEGGQETNVAAARVELLNLLDVATDSNLKGSALSDMPEEYDGEKWEWTETQALVLALRHGMSALVRDMSTLRVPTSGMGRELDVKKFRMALETLLARQIQGDGATIVITEGDGGDVNIKVHFEPPMSNPMKEDVGDSELTSAQILVGNMMAYAFTRRNQETPE